MDTWPKNSPDSLETLCVNFVVENIFEFLERDRDSRWHFKSNVSFPRNLSDKILDLLVHQTKHLHEPDDSVFSIFRERPATTLTRLELRYTAVNEEDLEYLCQHPVREVDISYCSDIATDGYINSLNKASRTLQTLRIGGTVQFQKLFFLLAERHKKLQESGKLQDRGDAESICKEGLLTLPNLRAFFIRDVKYKTAQEMHYAQPISFLDLVVAPLTSLTHLDMCGCQFVLETLESIGSLRLPNLVSLSLSDVLNGSVKALDNLCQLTQLRHLDISQGDDEKVFIPVKYSIPSDRLRNLVQAMPSLTSLDISGTNLAGVAPIQPISHRLDAKSASHEPAQELQVIEGLEGRTFEFLGLLDCSDDASHRQNIPAKSVSGDSNEEQIICSVRVYRDKPSLLMRAFNHLFNLFRYGTVKNQCAALEGILAGMSQHKHDRHVQISGSASLFYIVKGDQREHISFKQKRKVIDCILEAMERLTNEHTMCRNGCLTLCHFTIPNEVMYCYNRLVRVLLQMLRAEFEDEFMQRIGIFLLNSLACQVEGQQKQALGDLGTIEVMCNIIKQRLERKECDEILEVAWSTLWNVTDETAPNCERFMDEDGMYLFLDCLKEFPDKEELLRNMMGLMGNIAEVVELRPVLMIPEYVTVFSDFLESTKDGIEVSYNAAGVLAHMLSDGPAAWKVLNPSRNEVIHRMETAIERWPLNSRRNINYRSFEPILRLVRGFDSEASQYWAIWALCNLTQVYPDKYCKLLRDEHGLDALQLVRRDPRPKWAIKQLARQVEDFLKRKLEILDAGGTLERDERDGDEVGGANHEPMDV